MKAQGVIFGSMLLVILTTPAYPQGDAPEHQDSGQNMSQSGNSAGATSTSSNQAAQVNGAEAQSVIKTVQRELTRRGYYRGRVDGLWGPRSTAALKKYQQAKDLQATGVMDQQTADKLGLKPSEFSAFEGAAGQQSGAQGSQMQSPAVQPGNAGGNPGEKFSAPNTSGSNSGQ